MGSVYGFGLWARLPRRSRRCDEHLEYFQSQGRRTAPKSLQAVKDLWGVVDDKASDRIQQHVQLIAPYRMAAVLKNSQIRIGNQLCNLH